MQRITGLKDKLEESYKSIFMLNYFESYKEISIEIKEYKNKFEEFTSTIELDHSGKNR